MIILKNEFSDFIYLDVVTQYSQNFSSQVSQHPVDGSGVVSDHVIKQNPKIQMTGVITGADFNTSKPELTSEDRSFIGIDRIVVESEVASAVSVSYEDTPYNLLPDVAGQFFTDTLPDIENISEGRGAIYSEKVLFSILQSFYENKSQITLFEFDNDRVVESISDLIITNLVIRETAETGDSLTFNITLERVTFANLLEEEIPEDVQQSFAKKNAEREKKGGQSTTEVTQDGVVDLDSGPLSFLRNR